MKKRFAILGVAALLMMALVVPTAFAEKAVDNPNDAQNNWFNQMFQFHSQWLDNAEKNGEVSKEQANNWRNHFNYMQEFHNENGFGMMNGNGNGNGFGGCWGAQGANPAPMQPQAEKTSI
jgi:hypothetical protein